MYLKEERESSGNSEIRMQTTTIVGLKCEVKISYLYLIFKEKYKQGETIVFIIVQRLAIESPSAGMERTEERGRD